MNLPAKEQQSAQPPVPPRDAIFISHATPEDNAFTLWLGGRLTALGYHVFADILRLKGGDDWERVLEAAIRDRAKRFLLVASTETVQKQGVRNEINLAVETAKRIKEDGFVVPLKVAPYQAPLSIAQAQYIDFEKGWNKGLGELLKLLNDVGIPKADIGVDLATWQELQLRDARSITAEPEELVSNWLKIETLPETVIFYDFKAGISIGAAQAAIRDCPFPIASHNRGFISFAPAHQLQEHFGDGLPIQATETCDTNTFLDKGWKSQRLLPKDCRAKFTDIVRRAMDQYLEDQGLSGFEYADGKRAWWATSSRTKLEKHPFEWGNLKGRRQLVGHSEKRGFYWHYGISCWARSGPVRHIRVGGKVIFTSDGVDIIGDARRVHRMRRSFCKGWRNDKWRDLLLTFLSWVSGGATIIDIPMGENALMRVALPPMSFTAAFGMNASDSQIATLENEEDDDDVMGEPDDDDDGRDGDESEEA